MFVAGHMPAAVCREQRGAKQTRFRRPVFRVPVSPHDSLTAWLSPIAKRLRQGLGEDERILLAFDRGGVFSSQLADLRDAGIEFVTYERARYPAIL
jgi:hypothetical protein